MERYESYKDSGVKWLGEIPGHWEVKRLGSYFTERRSKVSDKDYAPLSVTKNGIFPQLENVAKSNDSDNRKLVKENDFVINSRSDRKGSSGVSSFDGSVSLINIVLRPRITIYPPFCNYLLKSTSFIEEYYRNGRGIVADLWTTRYDEMKIIKMALPPKSEQTAIANYLDSVTSKIDEAISQQQKMIDLLNERKQIIIQNAVTKGLDPNAKMKDSGVEWIGEIPGHWGISSVKRISSIILGKMLENAIDGKGFPYLCAKDVHKYNIDFSSLKKMFFREKEKNKYAVKKGDLLVVEGGAAGSSALVNIEVQNVYIQNSLMIVRCNKSIMKNEYLCYLLNSMVSRGYSESICNKATIMHFTKEKLGDTVITVPPIIEQTAIANYLDSVTSKIDSSISQCNKMISLLQERKQIIINDVVTGKVKVV